VNRRAVVLALAAFAAVLVPAADGHAAGFSYAFAMPPQVTAPGMFTGAITPAPAAASPVELARQAATTGCSTAGPGSSNSPTASAPATAWAC
jgi:uncharacterized transporter YbjL